MKTHLSSFGFLVICLWPCLRASPPSSETSSNPFTGIREQRLEQVEKSLEEGKISELQADLMALLNQEFPNPQSRQQAIREWREKNGRALEAAKQRERAAKQASHDTFAAARRAHRSDQIREDRSAGKISRLDAELMTLVNAEYADPRTRQQALRAWHEQNGQALEAERELKRAALEPQRRAFAAKAREARLKQIESDLFAGRIGPLKAEFMVLSNQEYTTPAERNQALRVWMDANRNALRQERPTRR